MKLRVLITGSRNYQAPEPIRRELEKLPPGTVVIHGGARGADELAGTIAAELGLEVIACPADWKKHGKAAGPIRNQQMLVDHKPDFVIAFPLGESRGTHDMIRRAKAAGVEVKVIEQT